MGNAAMCKACGPDRSARANGSQPNLDNHLDFYAESVELNEVPAVLGRTPEWAGSHTLMFRMWHLYPEPVPARRPLQLGRSPKT
ncbi:hypothetical protein SKAU_G00029780 [Synaphobranchus kaupii]|uniref:Uncharacterized protein n=1 Tax=Synaphobranchus kaupii TaxID=118154 RepID=A0A9Q1JEX9_SYNKA|nr:hypothetical protein SKAU_G00029780 [Synaphobranchus kaupii]